jgi:hypothetical protein
MRGGKTAGVADERDRLAEQRALSPAELAAFTAHLRPLVEARKGQEREAVAYLTARDTVAGLDVG